MGDRYSNKTIFLNQDSAYDEIFEKRDIRLVRQYGTTPFLYPDLAEMSTLKTVQHIWAASDRYYKLAIKHYKDSQYWWVIALYNMQPTEASLLPGDVIRIPLPLGQAIRVMRG